MLAIGLFAVRIVAGTTAHKEIVPLARAGHGVFVVGGHASGPAGDMVVKKAVIVPRDRVFGFEDRQEVEPFDLRLEIGGNLRSRHCAEGREDIDVRAEIIHLVGRPVPCPAPVGKGAQTAFPDRGFAPAHIGVVDIEAVGLAVVGNEHDDGVIIQVLLFQERHEASDVVVEVCHHPEILGLFLGDLASERGHEFLWRVIATRCVTKPPTS